MIIEESTSTLTKRIDELRNSIDKNYSDGLSSRVLDLKNRLDLFCTWSRAYCESVTLAFLPDQALNDILTCFTAIETNFEKLTKETMEVKHLQYVVIINGTLSQLTKHMMGLPTIKNDSQSGIIFDSFVKKASTAYEEIQTDLNSSRKIHADIESLKKDAEHAAGVISTSAMGGRYGKNAFRHQIASIFFTFIAFFFMLLLVNFVWEFASYLLDGIKSSKIHEIQTAAIILRIFLATVFIPPTWYAIMMAAKHFNIYRINSQRHLELTSINAYLDSLPNEKKEELLFLLAPKYFGNYQHESKKDLKEGQGFLSIFKEVLLFNKTKDLS